MNVSLLTLEFWKARPSEPEGTIKQILADTASYFFLSENTSTKNEQTATTWQLAFYRSYCCNILNIFV